MNEKNHRKFISVVVERVDMRAEDARNAVVAMELRSEVKKKEKPQKK